MFALAQAPPDHAQVKDQRNRRTSFCGRRSRCRADLIAAVGDRCPVGATADGSRADDGRCCIPASGPLARPAADVVLQWKAHVRTLAAPSQSGILLRDRAERAYPRRSGPPIDARACPRFGGRARWHDQDGVRCIAPALTSGSRLKIAFEPSIDSAGGVLITAVGRRRSTDFGRPV